MSIPPWIFTLSVAVGLFSGGIVLAQSEYTLVSAIGAVLTFGGAAFCALVVGRGILTEL